MAHSIGKTIAALRKAKGWTQIELAEKLNVSDKAVSKWEKDNGSPSIEFFPVLAKLFGVTIDYLMTGNEIETETPSISNKKQENIDDSINYEDWIIPLLNNGIIVIDRLLEENNLVFAKKALNQYPIHLIETLNTLIQQSSWRELFQFAVDNNDGAFADYIIKGKREDIEKQALSYFCGSKALVLNINKKHLYIIKDGKRQELLTSNYSQIVNTGKNRVRNLEEAIKKIQEVKQRIINELLLKLDKEKVISKLTKEYFETELKKGNVRIVIIDLCRRLEAILKYAYHYEGDFSEMLDVYCKDEIDPCGKIAQLLNKLRMQRNNSVHIESNNETLSLEDMQYCIDYICKMA